MSTKRPTRRATTAPDLRERLLQDFTALQVPVRAEDLDAALTRAEREGLPYLEFLKLLIGAQADRRRERAVARRLREARFRDPCTLATFDWGFNAGAIDRAQVEGLATADFIRRRTNLVLVGQSGVGKSHIVQALGRQACASGYRVRYTTSAALLEDLTASLADQTLPRRVRYYAGFDLLVIDEFGFERLERAQAPQAASLLYKLIDARAQQRSTAVVTNLDFEGWGEYLGDPPLAMALLDRVVDGAIILRIKGKSYRAHRAQQRQSAQEAQKP
jgi:DNA replication protein DnaC